MQFNHINAVGIELEGAWSRFGSPECHHYDDCDCCEHYCRYDDREDSECWYLDCDHECTDEECEDDCQHEHDNSCYSQECTHECDERCCTHDHDGDCQSVPYPLSNHWHEDGSVNGFDSYYCSGEAVSPICFSLEKADKWIRQFHPDRVNRTCGTHIHVSTVKDEHLLEYLSTEVFYEYFMEFIKEWSDKHIPDKDHYFYERVNGDNEYCCPNFTKCYHHGSYHRPADQLGHSHQRYSHLNFCAWHEHGTVEIRIFHGMKTPDLIMSAVVCVVECIESYLSGYRSLADYRQDQATIKEFAEQVIKADLVETEYGKEELIKCA